MKISIYIIFLFLFVFLNSCEKELDYKDLDYEPQIVLNGLMYQDSIIKINVASTRSILDADSVLPFLDNAEVKLYENDVFVEDLIYDSLGMYHSTNKAKANTSYRIEAKTNNIEAAVAKFDFTELADSRISNINLLSQYDTSIAVDDPIDTIYNLTSITLDFDLLFNDNAEEENYYNFGSIGNFYELMNTHTYTSGYEYVESHSIEKINSLYLNFRDYGDYDKYFSKSVSSFNGYEQNYHISDNIFNGEEVEFGLTTTFYTKSLEPIQIILYSYPYDYIHFHNTGYRYINNEDNAFSQPINIYSNVENGLGIVCAVSCSRQTINLSDLSVEQ